MSKLVHVRNQAQKEVASIFDSICQRHNRGSVWADMMCMYATAISNAVDRAHKDTRERREAEYKRCASKYSPQELEGITKIFALITQGIDEDQDQDFLGELYMALQLGNDKSGQFFTPYSVCRAMAAMQEGVSDAVNEKGWISVNDPACGAGALLVAFANECKRKGINYQKQVLFVAQDLDYATACMCYIQLSLLGCPGYVVCANTITNPVTMIDKRGLIPTPGQEVWYTPMYFSDVWQWRIMFANCGMMEKQEPVKEKPKEYAADDEGQLKIF